MDGMTVGRLLLAGVLSGGLVLGAQARSTGPLSIEDRSISRSGAAMAATPAAADADGLFILLQQQNQLEEQIQFLQGQVEELRHQMERMRTAERERYLDLDARINSLADLQMAGDRDGLPSLPDSAGAPSADNDAEADQQAYNAARDHLGNRDFEAAAKAFEQYLAEFPNGEYRGYAHFWLGRVYSSRQQPDYGKARAQFEAVLESYPDHPQAAPSQYSLAVLQARAGDVSEAKANLTQLLENYPDSDEVAQARTLLSQLNGND